MNAESRLQASVVIPTHNRHKGLRALLADLSQQDTPPSEVVVVDSRDGLDSEPVVAEAIAAGLPARHLITDNAIATKRNCGAGQAQGDLLVFLDDDMRVPPEFISRHLDAHAGSNPVAASGPIRFPREWVERSNYYRFKQCRHGANELTPMTVPPHRFASMNCSLTSAAFQRIGGFDEDYKHYGGEDLDFAFRAARSGVPLTLAPNATSIHDEVQMSWKAYFAKVHRAAYFGIPLLVEKNPESTQVATMQVIGAGPATTPLLKALGPAIRASSRRKLVQAAALLFDKVDRQPLLFTPKAYLAATLMANSLGYSEHEKSRPYEPLF